LHFVHLQVAALQQARQVRDMGTWPFLLDLFCKVQLCFVVKIRMRQSTRRDGDFDATDEINTIGPLFFY
jgi:hypothetical protein